MASDEPRRVEVPTITLETVDQAIYDWFDSVVDSHVQHPTGERKKVPVVFSSGERWVSSRERRGIRDKNGVLILPIISIRRTAMDATPVLSAAGVEDAKIRVSRRISSKTNTLQNANAARSLSNKMVKPVVYEVTTIPFPDFSTLTFEIQIQCSFNVHMNSIVEKIVHELDIQKTFVMSADKNKRHAQTGVDFEKRKQFAGGYFVGFVDPNIGSGDNFDEFTDQERIVRHSFTVRVPTYLLLDPEGEKPSVTIEKTAFSVQMGDEQVCFVEDPADIELLFSARDPVAVSEKIRRR